MPKLPHADGGLLKNRDNAHWLGSDCNRLVAADEFLGRLHLRGLDRAVFGKHRDPWLGVAGSRLRCLRM